MQLLKNDMYLFVCVCDASCVEVKEQSEHQSFPSTSRIPAMELDVVLAAGVMLLAHRRQLTGVGPPSLKVYVTSTFTHGASPCIFRDGISLNLN